MGVRKSIQVYEYDNNDGEFAKIIELSQAALNCKKSDIDKIIDFSIDIKKRNTK